MPASFVASGKCFSAVVPLWHGSLQCSNSQLSACARHAQSQQSEAQVTKLWMLEPAGRLLLLVAALALVAVVVLVLLQLLLQLLDTSTSKTPAIPPPLPLPLLLLHDSGSVDPGSRVDFLPYESQNWMKRIVHVPIELPKKECVFLVSFNLPLKPTPWKPKWCSTRFISNHPSCKIFEGSTLLS